MPGYKAGGPIRSIQNLVEKLASYYNFYIITRDRDFGDKEPYTSANIGQWQQVGAAQVYYASPGESLAKVAKNIEYEHMYINSFFSPHFSLKPLLLRKLGKLKKVPVTLAPRGELLKNTMKLKRYKKIPYFWMFKLLGLPKGIRFQATSAEEEEVIYTHFGRNTPVVLCTNMFNATMLKNKAPAKQVGAAKLVFVARLSPKKNLHGALEALKNVTSRIDFDIIGPIEGEGYWESIKNLIDSLPENIQVSYLGAKSPAKVEEALTYYHGLFFPTIGENFGHSILEAMAAGCVPVISNTTPWLNLEEHEAGYACPLEETALMEAVENLAAFDAETWQQWSANAAAYARKISQDEQTIQNARRLFDWGYIEEIAWQIPQFLI